MDRSRPFIPVPAVSECALGRLKRTGSVSVHSSYRNTVNLKTDEGLIALQTAGSPRSPLSVILPFDTAGMAALAASAQRGISVTADGSIVTEEAVLTADRASGRTDVYSPAVPRTKTARVPQLHRLAQSILTDAGPRGLACLYGDGEGDLVTDAARSFLAKAREALSSGDQEGSARALLRLLGLGGGLTPAGDDFLCGAAAALTAFGKEDGAFGRSLLSGIREGLPRTNDISAAFLACAADGLASEAVTLFFSEEAAVSEEELARKFLAIGHSSGTDSLCGIETVLSYLKEGSI